MPLKKIRKYRCKYFLSWTMEILNLHVRHKFCLCVQGFGKILLTWTVWAKCNCAPYYIFLYNSTTFIGFWTCPIKDLIRMFQMPLWEINYFLKVVTVKMKRNLGSHLWIAVAQATNTGQKKTYFSSKILGKYKFWPIYQWKSTDLWVPWDKCSNNLIRLFFMTMGLSVKELNTRKT